MQSLSQTDTPLVSALQQCANRKNAPFHTPGHKRGQGASIQQKQLFGEAAFRADLPELPDLDNLFAPEGVILQAQTLAAEAFGAKRTWFLANGSTCGIEAAILATCGPGEKLILPRNVHSSAISGMVLSGARPIYMQPDYSQSWDLCLGVSPAEVERALIENPDAKGVLVVSPSYHGVCVELEAIAHLTHAYNIPLIVDEAHAPHFTFHPDFPISALAAGADIAVHSAHKVLSAFTQAALLHHQGNRVNGDRLFQSLQLTQSTSPSYLLLGSLDAARHQMAVEGRSLMARTLELADRAYRELSELDGIGVFQPGQKRRERARGRGGDRTRITVDVSALGLTGFEADELLHERFGVTAELPALHHLMFIVSLGNTEDDITQLVEGFRQLCAAVGADRMLGPHPKSLSPNIFCGERDFRSSSLLPTLREEQSSTGEGLGMRAQDSKLTRPPLTPRQAFFSPKISLPIDQATGHICAETICPYPPGIPVLLPGEPITQAAIARLQTIQTAGGIITGCSDPSLKTILVVDS